jgi:hypothetical protein
VVVVDGGANVGQHLFVQQLLQRRISRQQRRQSLWFVRQRHFAKKKSTLSQKMQALLANLNQQVKEEVKKEKLEAAKGKANNDDDDNDDNDDDDFGLDGGNEAASNAAVVEKDKNTPPFDVSDPNINVVDVEALVKKLERNDPDVDAVNLNSFVTPDGMPGLPSHVVAVLDALKRNRYVLDVQITGAGLENDQAKAVANVLKLNTTIKALNLETNNFSGPGLSAIIESLAHNQTLTALKVSHPVRPQLSLTMAFFRT